MAREKKVRTKRGKKKLIIILLIAAGAAFAAWFFLFRTKAPDMSTFTIPDTTTLEKTDLEQTVAATGVFEAASSRTVASQFSYDVTSITVSVGDVVEKGQTLCTLDTSEIDADIADLNEQITDAEEADALELAQARRKRDAAPEGSEERQNLQDQVDTLKLKDSASQLREQLAGLKEDKASCTITAPITGTITAINGEVGLPANSGGSGTSSTNSSGSLFIIQDLTSLKVSASVPEYDALDVKAGQTAHITTDVIEDKIWDGTVTSVSPVADENGYFTVVVTLASGETAGLTAGVSAKMEIVLAQKENVYAVPFDAVVEKPDGTKVVYALAGGFAMSSGASGERAGAPSMSGASGEAPAEFSNGGGDRQTFSSNGSTNSESTGYERTEIVVTTGLETDYLIEISGADLKDGLAIINDPSGTSVGSDTSGGMMGSNMMIGGGGPTMRVAGGRPMMG